jgi:hypothetical protein
LAQDLFARLVRVHLEVHLVAFLVILDDLRVDGGALRDPVTVLEGVVGRHEEQVTLQRNAIQALKDYLHDK